MGKLTRQECKDLVDSVSLAIGEQTNVHHCKGGKNNDRCYIKRLKHGYVIFCHHCGSSGYAPDTYVPIARLQADSERIRKGLDESVYGDSLSTVLAVGNPSGEDGGRGYPEAYRGVQFSLPADITHTLARWDSSEAKTWVINNGIKADTLKKYPIYWSKRRSAVILPIYSDNILVGFQQRKFPPVEGEPKYKTYLKKGWSKKDGSLDILAGRTEHTGASDNADSLGEGNNCLLICEDYLSAIRCAECGNDALPLFGTELSDATFTSIIQNHNYKTIIVALDDDNSIVRDKARQLVKRFSFYGRQSRRLASGTDPKRLGENELRQFIKATQK